MKWLYPFKTRLLKPYLLPTGLYLEIGFCKVIRVRLGLQDDSLMMGLVALKQEGEKKTSLSLPTPTLPPSLFILMQSAGQVCEQIARRWSANPEELFLGTEWGGILILDFPAIRIRRNKCLLFKPPMPWHFIMVAQTD